MKNLIKSAKTPLLLFALAFTAWLCWSQSPTIVQMIRTSIIDSDLVLLTNEKRADSGLSVLVESPILKQAAQAKADDMAANGYFAHTAPNGTVFTDWLKEYGYDYLYAGENLAVKFTQSSSVTEAWMKSPTHRANLLSAKYTEIGVGLAEGFYKGKKTTFVVQLFGHPKIPLFIKTSSEKIVASGSWIDADGEEKMVVVGKKVELALPSIGEEIISPFLLRFLPL